jgi:hypothetical protein
MIGKILEKCQLEKIISMKVYIRNPIEDGWDEKLREI